MTPLKQLNVVPESIKTTVKSITRRSFMNQLGSGLLLSSPSIQLLAKTSSSPVKSKPHRVIVVGAGFGGATAAKYLRHYSNKTIEVLLIDPNEAFISCPLSNLVIAGEKDIREISHSRNALNTRYGVQLIKDSVIQIDGDKKNITLNSGITLSYDKLILAPGVDFSYANIPGMNTEYAQENIVHAWKAGSQTSILKKQLQAMPNGGVFAITIPQIPYRCPPGPYERACQVAVYFKKHKPRSKIIILDANEEVTSKPHLFKKAWQTYFSDIIEYRNNHQLLDIDSKDRVLKFEIQDDLSADVINLIPPMQAGRVASKAGLANANARWCEVNFLTFESVIMPHVHVIGDAIQTAALMPKSAHMANQHAKVCAAAIVNLLEDKEPNQHPIYNNVCYSIMGEHTAAHVSSVHRFNTEKQTMLVVPGAGGLSSNDNALEYQYALNWAQNIWTDTLK